jgi:hypothetical protein
MPFSRVRSVLGARWGNRNVGLVGVAAVWVAAAAMVALPGVAAAAGQLKLDHVVVSYDGIGKAYAEAIGRTVAAARNTAVEQFAFDMPDTITVSVTVDPKGNVGLMNDGQDHFMLTVRSEQDLRKPSTTGTFHLYGMCHEVGHLAMYRLIRDHSWMTSDAAEGWAHYMGSRLVDAVYAKEGPDLWPDRYDYREDGMKRLARQWQNAKDEVRGPVAWQRLSQIVGDQGVAPIFRAWGKAEFDPADPADGMGKALLADSSTARAAPWWVQSKELLVLKRPKSKVAAETAEEKQLAGQSRELAHDDGKAADKASFAGGGHAVRFEVPGDNWYVTEVRIHGSRYGNPAAPKEDFSVWLCDEEFKAIAKLSYPYARFAWGAARWVSLKVKPTRVPKTFIICVGFNPTATKGVFVSRDAEGSGNSLTGLPGREGHPFEQGDWMIRATVSQR